MTEKFISRTHVQRNIIKISGCHVAPVDVEVQFLGFVFKSILNSRGNTGTSLTASMLSNYCTLSFCFLYYTSLLPFWYFCVCVYLHAGRHLCLWVHKYKCTPCVWQLKNNLQCYSLETLNPIVS